MAFVYVIFKEKKLLGEEYEEILYSECSIIGALSNFDAAYDFLVSQYDELESVIKKFYLRTDHYGELRTKESVEKIVNDSLMKRALVISFKKYGFTDKELDQYYIQKCWLN